jgi:hypothetical protein
VTHDTPCGIIRENDLGGRGMFEEVLVYIDDEYGKGWSLISNFLKCQIEITDWWYNERGQFYFGGE